jgi:hypothetical protein
MREKHDKEPLSTHGDLPRHVTTIGAFTNPRVSRSTVRTSFLQNVFDRQGLRRGCAGVARVEG